MHRIILFFIVISFCQNIIAQKNDDIGVMLGGSNYIGDVNMETPFRLIRPAGKVFYRKNFHSRLALRGDLSYARLEGNDALANFQYQELRNKKFSTNILEAGAFFEFNYLRFEQSVRKRYISPYLGGGIGFMMVDFSFSSNVMENFTIPFGFGLKLGIDDRIAIGLEYTFHRTFSDNLDQISDWRYNSSDVFSLKQRANAQNDDWFTFFGVFISYKLKDCVTCPAYL